MFILPYHRQLMSKKGAPFEHIPPSIVPPPDQTGKKTKWNDAQSNEIKRAIANGCKIPSDVRSFLRGKWLQFPCAKIRTHMNTLNHSK